MDKNCLATHFTHPEKLLFEPEIILIWTLCVVHKSWQCLTYMKYVIPSISNDYCVKRNIKGTRETLYEMCWGKSSGDAIPLTYVPVLSFRTIDVDIVSRLCIKSRMIGYTAQWAAWFLWGGGELFGVIHSSITRWGQSRCTYSSVVRTQTESVWIRFSLLFPLKMYKIL